MLSILRLSNHLEIEILRIVSSECWVGIVPTINPTIDPTIDSTINPTIDLTIDPTIDPTIAPAIDPRTHLWLEM